MSDLSREALRLAGWDQAERLPLETPRGQAERRRAWERAQAIEAALEALHEQTANLVQEIDYWQRQAEEYRTRAEAAEADLHALKETPWWKA
jgi:chromosome segregation ATPase